MSTPRKTRTVSNGNSGSGSADSGSGEFNVFDDGLGGDEPGNATVSGGVVSSRMIYEIVGSAVIVCVLSVALYCIYHKTNQQNKYKKPLDAIQEIDGEFKTSEVGLAAIIEHEISDDCDFDEGVCDENVTLNFE
eukprot:UN01636